MPKRQLFFCLSIVFFPPFTPSKDERAYEIPLIRDYTPFRFLMSSVLSAVRVDSKRRGYAKELVNLQAKRPERYGEQRSAVG